MKSIEEVIHLYLGCDVLYLTGTKCSIWGVHKNYIVIELPNYEMIKVQLKDCLFCIP